MEGEAEGDRRGRREGGLGQGEGKETRAPHLPHTQQGVNLKGCSVSPWEDGVGLWGREAQSVEGSGPAGQHRELHVTQLSMTTRERGRRGRDREGEKGRERETEGGENMEKLSCGQRALSWSRE